MRYILVALLSISMVVIPYSLNGNAPLYVSIISFLSIIGILLKIPGAEFLLIAVALCLPAGWVGTSGLVFPEVDRMRHAFLRFIQYIVPLVGVGLLLRGEFENKRQILRLLVGTLFVGMISTLITFETLEMHNILCVIGYSYAFLFICFYDERIRISDVFLYLDILFGISFVYGVMEYFFGESPYQYITDATTSIDSIGRARGILGHPLYLSGLALFYQATLFIRYLIFKKVYVVQEILCVFLALIVVSRTTIVVLLLEYLFFVFISKGYRSIKFGIGNVSLLLFFSFIVLKYADSVVFDIITRFVEGNVDHREGAFDAVFSMFFDYPLGVGYFNIMERLWKGGYGGAGFMSDFSTVDNLFLSQIAAYGIFSVVKVAYYFYFLFDAYKNRKRNPLLYRSVLFLYFPFVFESFSFDWDTSIFLCMLLYGFLGYIYRFSKYKQVHPTFRVIK